MQNSASDIARLCESWWSCPCSDSPVEHRSHVMQFLALLDWDLPIPFSPGPAAEEAGALCYLLRADTGTTLICYFLRPGLLEAPSRLLEEKCDHSLLTHALAAESHSPNIQYLFISDLGRHYIYSMPEGELLASADTAEEFNTRIQPILRRASVQDGALEDLPRPSRCGRARRLDDWREYWKEKLQDEAPVSDEALHLLLDRLVLLRYLFRQDVLRRTRARLEERFLQLCEPGPSRGLGDKLRRLFHDMWLDWRIALFTPHMELEAFLNRAPSLPGLLQASTLLSETLFSVDIILESFNNGDAQEKLRVRMVPDHNEERELLLRRQTVDTIDSLQVEVDLRDEGYRAITHWLDKVLDCYEEIDARFDTPTAALCADDEEPDLFLWSERNHGRPEACIDPISHLCAQGLRIRCNTPAQRRLASLLLTLRLIDLCHEKHQARDRLPQIDPVFTESQPQKRVDAPRIVLPPISDLD